MPKTKVDAYEREVLKAFDAGRLESVATKAELARLKAAARATAIKEAELTRLRGGGASRSEAAGSRPPGE